MEFRVATSELGAGLDTLEAALRAERLPEAAILELRLVAEEILTNLAKYGHDDGAAHWAHVGLTLVAGDVILELTDDGRPFNPLAAPPPEFPAQAAERPIGGLGIHLVRSLVDEAEYVRRGSQNVLTLRKRAVGPCR